MPGDGLGEAPGDQGRAPRSQLGLPLPDRRRQQPALQAHRRAQRRCPSSTAGRGWPDASAIAADRTAPSAAPVSVTPQPDPAVGAGGADGLGGGGPWPHQPRARGRRAAGGRRSTRQRDHRRAALALVGAHRPRRSPARSIQLCSGQVTASPWTMPWLSGPPLCGQRVVAGRRRRRRRCGRWRRRRSGVRHARARRAPGCRSPRRRRPSRSGSFTSAFMPVRTPCERPSGVNSSASPAGAHARPTGRRAKKRWANRRSGRRAPRGSSASSTAGRGS